MITDHICAHQQIKAIFLYIGPSSWLGLFRFVEEPLPKTKTGVRNDKILRIPGTLLQIFVKKLRAQKDEIVRAQKDESKQQGALDFHALLSENIGLTHFSP